MDAFTERILERARERQRKLQEYGDITPLKENKETNKIKSHSQPIISDTVKDKSRKEVVSDTCLLKNSSYDDLKENNSEGNIARYIRQNSKTRVSSDMPGSPLSQTKTLNIQKDNFNMEIKLCSSENVRVQVEIEEQSDDDNGNCENSDVACVIREESKDKLKRMGKLYSGGEECEISSPIHRTENKFVVNNEPINQRAETSTSEDKPRRGLSRLADLAQNINQWEDEIVTPKNKNNNGESVSKKRWKPQAPEPPSNANKSTAVRNPPSPVKATLDQEKNEVAKSTPKQLKWDKAVLESLESQGFARSTSNSRLVYNYNNSQEKAHTETEQTIESIKEEDEPKVTEKKSTGKHLPGSPSRVNIKGSAVANKAALFESSPARNVRDPALMSVAERKALFEKNMGAALIPKAAFGMAVPIHKTETPKTSVKSLVGVHNKSDAPAAKKVEVKSASEKKYPAPKPPVATKQNTETSVGSKSTGIASKMAALLENKTTIAQEQIENNVREQRQKEMDALLNRFNRNKEMPKENVAPQEESESEDETDITETTAMISTKTPKIVGKNMPPPPPPPIPSTSESNNRLSGKRSSTGDSPKVASVLENVKRIKVSSNKPGRLYPCLSDIEAATETEPEQTNTPTPDTSFEESFGDSDAANTSFGREILQAVCHKQTPQKRPIYDHSTASESDMSDILDDMDDYLDEAMAHNSSNSAGPSPPKYGRVKPSPEKATQPSNSFNYKNYSPQKSTSNPSTPVKPSVPRKSDELPAYVVDGENVLPLTHTVSFYRKQQNQVSTPLRQISKQPLIEEAEDTECNDEVEKKIRELTGEVNKQQLVISQTSQALNLCYSTPEFMGSTEQVEAEKVLLLATNRRLALLHEIQRLKVEGRLRPQGSHAQNVPLEKGTIVISNITLPLKKEYVRALAAAGGKGHHIVCLVKCGEQVVATPLASTVVNDVKNPETELYIPGVVTLNNVFSDFTVTFEVYCLQAQEEVIPHEVKYHINNKKPSAKLTPRKAKQDSKMVKPPKESPAGPQAVRTSTFALMGYVVFSIQAINRTHWTLNKIPSMSPLEGSVEMKVNCELAVSVEHHGFLTMFEDISGFGAWHRRWCLLKGHTLSYWKYPDDEKKMPPIDSFDLKNCITTEVGPVSRDICARPNTVLLACERDAQPNDKDSLTMVCHGKKTIIRHLLSADTKEERMEWCTKLNSALTALRMWGK